MEPRMATKFSGRSFKPIVYQNHLTLPVTEGSVKYRISVLKSVFQQVEMTQQEHRDSMIKFDKKEQEFNKNQDTDEYYDYSFNDELLDLEFNFYRVNRIASVLSMYAYLETTLNRICQQKQQKFDLPISVSDLFGNGIIRSRNYLDKFKLVDLSNDVCNGAWSNLINLNKLRNTLAHSEGDIELSRHLDNQKINKIIGLSLFGSTIMISNDYVVNTLDEIEKFLVYLCQN